MSLAVHVSGASLINVDFGAGSNLLGISVDGVIVSDTMLVRDVIVDHYALAPFDRVYSGLISELSFALVYFDAAQLAALRATRSPAVGVVGQMGLCGTLLQQGGYGFRLTVESPIDDTPVNYPTCFLADATPRNMSTGQQIWNMRIISLPEQISNTSATAVVWNAVP